MVSNTGGLRESVSTAPLSSTLNSESITTAATSKAVKLLNDTILNINIELENKVSRKDSYDVNILKYHMLVNNKTKSWSKAIKQAITDTSITGQAIWFPPGSYRVDETIVPDINTRFIGSGCGKQFSRLQVMDNSNLDLIRLNKTNMAFAIERMVLSGDCVFRTSTDWVLKSTKGSGIVIEADESKGFSVLNQINISHCIIEGFAEYGLKLDKKAWVCNIKDLDLRRNYIGGLYDAGSDNRFNSLNIYENGQLGAYLYRSSANQYSNVKVYLNGRYAEYDSKNATGIIMENCNRTVFTNIEVQQNYHNGVLLKNCKNIDITNFNFDENGYIQIKYPGLIPLDFSPVDLIITNNSYNIRGSQMVFSARENCNLDSALVIDGSCRDIDLMYDVCTDETALYKNEKLIDSGVRINVRSYQEEFYRTLESGNAKLVNLNTDLNFSKEFWNKSTTAKFKVSNSILTQTSQRQHDSIYTKIKVTKGHVYAVYAEINAPVGYNTRFLAYNQDTSYLELLKKDIIGTGSFDKYVTLGKATSDLTYLLQINRDINTSNWKSVSVKNIVLLDLTECFPELSFGGNDSESQFILSIIEKYGIPNPTVLIGDKAKLNYIMNKL